MMVFMFITSAFAESTLEADTEYAFQVYGIYTRLPINQKADAIPEPFYISVSNPYLHYQSDLKYATLLTGSCEKHGNPFFLLACDDISVLYEYYEKMGCSGDELSLQALACFARNYLEEMFPNVDYTNRRKKVLAEGRLRLRFDFSVDGLWDGQATAYLIGNSAVCYGVSKCDDCDEVISEFEPVEE